VLETQVELARKKLVGGDYAEAARDAEKALRLDPSSAEARQILDQAQSVIAESTKAAERLKAAVAKGDDAASAEAFWGLVQVAPNDPLAAEMTSHFEGRMKDQAREAQRLMGDARAAALSSGADKGDRFLDGDARRREADDDFKAGRFASAARRYVDARNRFRLVGKS
jgi:tetratricopeptide (TPR) repeat protein